MSAYCSKSEHCAFDVEKLLKRTDLNPDEISGIVEKLRAENYLNEARYAASFARDKFRFNKWGKNKIAFELGLKRIPQIFIDDALVEITDEYSAELCLELLQKKMATLKKEDIYQVKAKLFRFGISKGFETELVYKTVAVVLSSINEN